ncbi:DUF4432 family protein [Saccharopolyspora shandongensis]|uniref:DUF4432 family protein n=1 Tax=Saccharopolyspora shandongensis TaxID=418495 RepID=UPI00340658EE
MAGAGRMTPEPLRLASRDLMVGVLPAKGSDIVEIIDQRTGVDLMFRTPWAAWDTPSPAAWDSRSRWLSTYRGGWQVLCPNAGPERAVNGALWGFHGEASVVPWQIVHAAETEVVLQTCLHTAPVSLRRHLSVDGAVLSVLEEVTNLSDREREVMWVHHPAFGAPLVAEGARLYTSARTLVADADAPGTVLAPDSVHTWPLVSGADGRTLDLSVLPGPASHREIFGCLTDFERPYLAVVNPELDLAVTVSWDAKVFPHAWLWQEFCATEDYPWFRRAYALAVEPASTMPGTGTVAGLRRGEPLRLAPHETRSAHLTMTVSSAEGAVSQSRQRGSAAAGEIPVSDQ